MIQMKRTKLFLREDIIMEVVSGMVGLELLPIPDSTAFAATVQKILQAGQDQNTSAVNPNTNSTMQQKLQVVCHLDQVRKFSTIFFEIIFHFSSTSLLILILQCVCFFAVQYNRQYFVVYLMPFAPDAF